MSGAFGYRTRNLIISLGVYSIVFMILSIVVVAAAVILAMGQGRIAAVAINEYLAAKE